MSVIDNVVAAMDKSRGPAATIHRAELEEVIRLAQIGEEAAKSFNESSSDCPIIDFGFDQDCGVCPLEATCEKVIEYENYKSSKVKEGA